MTSPARCASRRQARGACCSSGHRRKSHGTWRLASTTRRASPVFRGCRRHWCATRRHRVHRHTCPLPHIQTNSAYLLLFVATAGTTITPFMQLYVQSAVVERGIGPEDLNAERAEVVHGLDLRQHRRRLHHHRDRRHPVRSRAPNRERRRRRRESARPVCGSLRGGALRRRATRRESARGGDPAGHGGVRDRRTLGSRKASRGGHARHPSSWR